MISGLPPRIASFPKNRIVQQITPIKIAIADLLSFIGCSSAINK